MKLKKIKVKERKLRDYFGYAYPDTGLIEIKKGLRQRQYLGTLVHEILHVLYPNDSETKISIHSNTLTHHIWNKGYRRIASQNKKRA